VETVQTPFSFEERDLDLGVSVGMAIFPEAGADIIALVAHARKALAESKRARAKPREAEVPDSGTRLVPLVTPLMQPLPPTAARVQ
jgi:predicted signal transduction protein with EAL and GGDEF domain